MIVLIEKSLISPEGEITAFIVVVLVFFCAAWWISHLTK